MPACNITFLIENETGSADLVAEHGLSVWIEIGDDRILFDAGQSPDGILRNAERLGINLSEADCIVVSHGHYDHTGALQSVLDLARDALVFMHPAAVRPRWSLHPGKEPRPIGIPDPVLQALQCLPPSRIIHTVSSVPVGRYAMVTGEVPRKTEFEDVGGPFYLDPLGERPDDLRDDQALWFETDQGIVVVAGCAHAGIINILHHVRHLSGKSAVRAIAGGFHLGGASPERMQRTIEELHGFGVQELYPCHCTGMDAANRLRAAFPDRTLQVHAGDRITF